MESGDHGEMNGGDLDVPLSPSEDTQAFLSGEDESEDARSWDLDIPLIPLRTMTLMFTRCVAGFYSSSESREQALGGACASKEGAALLTKMSHVIVETISYGILKVVTPQIVSQGGLRSGRSSGHVTEEEIRESLGNSVHHGLHHALGLRKTEYYAADEMRDLIAADVTNTVNRSLALMKVPKSATQPEDLEVEPQVCVMHPDRMVRLFELILTVARPKKSESCGDPGCAGIDSSKDARPHSMILPEDCSDDEDINLVRSTLLSSDNSVRQTTAMSREMDIALNSRMGVKSRLGKSPADGFHSREKVMALGRVRSSEDTKSLTQDKNEPEETRSWDLDIPLIPLRTMTLMFTRCIADSYPSIRSREQVMNGAYMSEKNASLLTHTSRVIVESISYAILKVVTPQIVSQGDLRNGRNCGYVTEEEIRESLGNSVHHGLHHALGLQKTEYYAADKMRNLIAAEVTNTVNRSLALVGVPRSATQPKELEVEPQVCLMHPDHMVRLFAFILLVARPKKPESCGDPGCAGIDSSKDPQPHSMVLPDDSAEEGDSNLVGSTPPNSDLSANQTNMGCGHFDIPLIPWIEMKLIFGKCIADVFPSRESRQRVMNGRHVRADAASLLTEKSHLVVLQISDTILKAVVPQVVPHGGLRNNVSDSYVTEDDVRYSLGNSIDIAIRAALELRGPVSPVSDKMLNLIAAEVTNTVNRALAHIRGPDSVTQPEVELEVEPRVCLLRPRKMVRLFAIILTRSVPKTLESYENHGPDAGMESEDSSENEEIPPIRSTAQSSEPSTYPSLQRELIPCVGSPAPSSDPSAYQGFESEDSLSVRCTTPSSDHSAYQSFEHLDYYDEELLQRDRIFIAAFVSTLVSHTAQQSNTSPYDVDIKGMVARMEKRTAGKLCATFPRSVQNIHVAVYKKLCWEFGSAKRQKAAMVCSDGYFEETVVRILKKQLQKSEGIRFVKMRRPFAKL